MLELLKNRYDSSSFKLKVELYIFPLLLAYLIFYLVNEQKNEVIKSPISLENLENRKFKGSYLELIKEIEFFCANNSIKIIKVTSEKRTITINAQSSISNLKKFTYYLEKINNFSQIKSLNLIKTSTYNYTYFTKISFDKFYLKTLEKPVIKGTPNKRYRKFKLKAIIANNVLINNKWLKKGEYIDTYELIHIDSNFIYLENKIKKIKVEIHKNEKLTK